MMSDRKSDLRLSDDAIAIILLCTPLALASKGELSSLTPKEWNDISERIAQSSFASAGGLLGMTAADIRAALEIDSQISERISRLLERSDQLIPELTRLEGMGIWIITREDKSYPQRLKKKLNDKSPVVLFGAGKRALVDHQGIAVVGSRDVSESGKTFARRLGEISVKNDLSVISGAARGVDRIAMTSCLEHGGSSVGVLADSLERVIMEPETRQAIDDGKLCLLTPLLPSAPFNVGNAMSRNKSIYALAEYAIVVDSSVDKGGTWEGALENLRKQLTPLFVRSGEETAPGNQELIRRGGIALTLEEIASDPEFMNLLDKKSASHGTTQPQQGDLLL